MAFIHLEAQISPDELLKAADQLSQPELEQFLKQLLARHAQRRAPSLPANEADLLRAINQGVPAEARDRYELLIARRKESTLTAAEYDELLRLSDEIEAGDAARAADLASLARLRGIPLGVLLDQLGIRAPQEQDDE
jgi:gamma-glutamyl phosphate reductase